LRDSCEDVPNTGRYVKLRIDDNLKLHKLIIIIIIIIITTNYERQKFYRSRVLQIIVGFINVFTKPTIATRIQTGSGIHPDSYLMSTGCSSPGGEAAGA
jgi:hypothetical protein